MRGVDARKVGAALANHDQRENRSRNFPRELGQGNDEWRPTQSSMLRKGP